MLFRSSFLRYQYGVYDYGDMALKLRSEETYEYDGNGNMTKKVTSSYTYLYEYDEAGNCVKETITNAAATSERIMAAISLNNLFMLLLRQVQMIFKYIRITQKCQHISKL